MNRLTKIQKRDGSIVDFDQNKIAEAIFKAAQAVGGKDKDRSEILASIVAQRLNEKYDGHTIPKVEEIQDLVEHVLMDEGHASTVKAYILYREKRKKIRAEKLKILGREDELKLPLNSIKVLAERYLKKDDEGKLIETPQEMFKRVADNIASADKFYNGDVEKTASEFFEMLSSLKFLPNSPTLMNAGNELQQLSGCFVLPIGDSIEEIFDGVKNAAIIHKSGGGTGFAFSRLRPKNDVVMSTKGVSSGPISFMKVYNIATEIIKQGGKRRGANMGILRVDHPDIMNFINCKEKEGSFNNFNISIGLTEKFMQAVENDEEYELFNPRIKENSGQLRARDVFNLIVTNAWKNGEPGIIFLDRINKDNPTPELGEIESTNPCVTGDMLIPTESGLERMEDLVTKSNLQEVQVAVDNRIPVNNGNGVLLINQQLGTSLKTISQAFCSGIKQVYEVETKAGYTIKATKDHKIRTSGGWRQLEDLKFGDQVLIQSGKVCFNENFSLPFKFSKELIGKNRKKYSFNFPHQWSQELGEVIGWLIGDGWLRSKDKNCRVGFTFGTDSYEVLNKLKPIINNWYGTNIKEVLRDNNVYHLSYHSKFFVEFFTRLGIKDWRSATKKVPESIFNAPKESVIGFLRGLFSADGTVRSNPKPNSEWVALSSKSKELLKEVQLLLLNLGIKSKIFDRSRQPRNGLFTYINNKGIVKNYSSDGVLYELGIFGLSREVFREQVGFMIRKKQEKLDNIKFQGFYKEKSYSEVKTIKKLSKEKVYDLTEPHTHSFISNGIVISNCGEQPLLPYESCNLGSIDLSKFVKNNNIDYEELKKVVHTAVHFLDNVIDVNNFPLQKFEETTKANRKIGLGVMGFADLLLQLSIPYNSDSAVELAEKVMGFVQEEAKNRSIALAESRGSFLNIEKSIYKGQKMRNATRTTIAPTGSIGMIADTSSGIEPLFAISFVKQNILGGNHKLLYVNKYFEKVAKDRGFHSQQLMEEIAQTGSVQDVQNVPEDVKKVFVVAHDIDPIWHIKIQAAFQRKIENAVSKTVNFTNDATTKDVEQAYLLAYKLGCKGVTIYRDGSRNAQVINLDTTKHHKKKEEEELCPQCKTKLYHAEGCSTCQACGYSKCSV